MDLPWFPFYVSDRVAHAAGWTPAQFGAYMRLIAYQWQRGELPECLEHCRRIAQASQAEWAKLWPTLEAEFPNGRAPWLDDLRSKQESRAETYSKRAAKAARARWNGAKQDATSIPQAMLKPCQSELDSEPESDSKENQRGGRKAPRLPEPIPDNLDRESWDRWIEYRQTCGRWPKWKQSTVNTEARKLAALPHEQQRAVVEYSLDNYRALYFDRRPNGGPAGESKAEARARKNRDVARRVLERRGEL